MNLNEELYKLARSCMISYFGVADLSKVEYTAIDQAGAGIGDYPYCVTMGISLPKDIVDRLPYRNSTMTH